MKVFGELWIFGPGRRVDYVWCKPSVSCQAVLSSGVTLPRVRQSLHCRVLEGQGGKSVKSTRAQVYVTCQQFCKHRVCCAAAKRKERLLPDHSDCCHAQSRDHVRPVHNSKQFTFAAALAPVCVPSCCAKQRHPAASHAASSGTPHHLLPRPPCCRRQHVKPISCTCDSAA